MLLLFVACFAILQLSDATDLINALQHKEFLETNLQEGSPGLQKLTDMIDDTRNNSQMEARKYECTALGYAASKRFTGINSKFICERLVASGADVHAIQFCGVTSLSLAINDGTVDTVEFLLRKGSDVDTRNNCRFTLLMLAAFNGNPDLVELLLQNAANPYLKDKEGRTAFDHVYANPHQIVGVRYNEQEKKWSVARWSAVENKMIDGGLYFSAKIAAYASNDLGTKLKLEEKNCPHSVEFDRRYRCWLILESCLNEGWVILNAKPNKFLKQPINYPLVRRKISEFLGNSFLHKK